MDKDVIDFLMKKYKARIENDPAETLRDEIIAKKFEEDYGLTMNKMYEAYKENILLGRSTASVILSNALLMSCDNIDDALCELDLVHKMVREQIIRIDREMNLGGKK